MDRTVIWPDPVPCRPENPVQGIRTCVALRTNGKCPWLNVDYCGIRADDMSDALSELGLDDLNWVLEDDLDADEVAEAAAEFRRVLDEGVTERGDAVGSVRWLTRLLEAVRDHDAGLSSRLPSASTCGTATDACPDTPLRGKSSRAARGR